MAAARSRRAVFTDAVTVCFGFMTFLFWIAGAEKGANLKSEASMQEAESGGGDDGDISRFIFDSGRV
jgi:hypothetical protein